MLVLIVPVPGHCSPFLFHILKETREYIGVQSAHNSIKPYRKNNINGFKRFESGSPLIFSMKS